MNLAVMILLILACLLSEQVNTILTSILINIISAYLKDHLDKLKKLQPAASAARSSLQKTRADFEQAVRGFGIGARCVIAGVVAVICCPFLAIWFLGKYVLGLLQ